MARLLCFVLVAGALSFACSQPSGKACSQDALSFPFGVCNLAYRSDHNQNVSRVCLTLAVGIRFWLSDRADRCSLPVIVPTPCSA